MCSAETSAAEEVEFKGWKLLVCSEFLACLSLVESFSADASSLLVSFKLVSTSSTSALGYRRWAIFRNLRALPLSPASIAALPILKHFNPSSLLLSMTANSSPIKGPICVGCRVLPKNHTCWTRIWKPMSGRRKQSGNSATCSYHKKRCTPQHTKPESKSKRGEKQPLLLRDLHKQSSAEEDWVWERGALDCSSRDPSALSFLRLNKTLPYGTLQIRFCSMWEQFHKFWCSSLPETPACRSRN